MIKIKTDSRKILTGDTFVAIPGISSDGHDYIEKAIENGASRIIAEHGNYSVETIIVPNTRDYLNKILKEECGYILNDMKIVGITGTNGKTTSCFLIYQMLNKLNIPCAYIGTIGFYLKDKVRNLPNTSVDIADLYGLLIEAHEQGYKHVVLEVSSQGLAMQRLVNIPFDIAVFTNLTQDHLDYHKTMENYALAKQQLFRQLKESGKALINSDDKYKDYYLLAENNNKTYGINRGDYKIEKFNTTSSESNFIYSFNNSKYEVKTSLIGKYNLYNLLSAIAVVHELGVDLEKINKTILQIQMPPGRMNKVEYKSNTIIVDYAHTPDAIENIIKTISDVAKGNIYVVFGCTGNRDKIKRPIMTDIVLKNSNKSIITIDDPHDEDPNSIVKDMLDGLSFKNFDICLDREKAIKMGIELLKENDVLLVLGKGHEEFIIMKDKRIPFNDLEVIDKILECKELEEKHQIR